jgi:hypothetical protein
MRADERRKFVDDAASAYEQAMTALTLAKDEEMIKMQRVEHKTQQRRKLSFEKRWRHMQHQEQQEEERWYTSISTSHQLDASPHISAPATNLNTLLDTSFASDLSECVQGAGACRGGSLT